MQVDHGRNMVSEANREKTHLLFLIFFVLLTMAVLIRAKGLQEMVNERKKL